MHFSWPTVWWAWFTLAGGGSRRWEEVGSCLDKWCINRWQFTGWSLLKTWSVWHPGTTQQHFSKIFSFVVSSSLNFCRFQVSSGLFFGRKHSHGFSTQFTICISEFNFCISLHFTRRCCFGGVRCCVSLKGGWGIRGKVSGLPLLKLLCFCPTQHNATHHPFPLRITAPSGMKSLPHPPRVVFTQAFYHQSQRLKTHINTNNWLVMSKSRCVTSGSHDHLHVKWSV